MRQLRPQRAAALQYPDVEFSERTETTPCGFLPDAATTILHVLLDDPLLPTAGHIAEIGIEQVVRGQRGKAGVNDTPLAFEHFVDGRLHVVVNAPSRNTAQRGKRAGVRIEEHFMPLAWVGDEHEGAAGAQFQVCYLEATVEASYNKPFFAPVELEGFAQRKPQWNVGCMTYALTYLATPVTHVFGHAAVAAGEALCAQFVPQFQRRATITTSTPGISLERLVKPILIRTQFAFLLAATVTRLRAFRFLEPFLDRVARQARAT